MFMFTLKPTAKKLLIIFCVIAISVCAVVLSFSGTSIKPTIAPPQDGATEPSLEQIENRGDDNASRTAYLNQFGWEVSLEPVEICDVLIPSEWNDAFRKFNEIQKQQGYDLSQYKGQMCKRYTYKVKNYPEKPDNVFADLLVLNGEIVAGDICSYEFSDLIQGLQYP